MTDEIMDAVIDSALNEMDDEEFTRYLLETLPVENSEFGSARGPCFFWGSSYLDGEWTT